MATETKPAAARTHRDSNHIRLVLDTGGPRLLWTQTGPTGEIHCYATTGGLVMFIDSDDGWTMLTECPSNSTADNSFEFGMMQRGDAGVRKSRA